MRRPMARSETDLFQPWDVVVIPVSDGRNGEKRRPALVISNRVLAQQGLLWVAMITSADNAPWPCDVPISDLARAGLPAASVIRPVKITCIDATRVLRRAGALDKKTAFKVGEKLREFVARV